jgi:hypothetical protein
MAKNHPESPKPPNHELSEMRCPVALEDVDLFGAGAQEHWYEAYEILHRESPVASPGRGSDPTPTASSSPGTKTSHGSSRTRPASRP